MGRYGNGGIGDFKGVAGEGMWQVRREGVALCGVTRREMWSSWDLLEDASAQG